MHRTQITLTDAQYLRLKQQSQADGRSIAELVRTLIDEAYGTSQERLKKAIIESCGDWADRDDIGDGAEYVERIRPGLG